MIRSSTFFVGAIATLSFNLAAAETLDVSPAEIRNLGIELAAAEIATEVAAVEATARVVIPPMGALVVTAPQSGLLSRLNVAVGDEVREGQVLAQLQSPEFLSLQREFLDALNTNLLARNEYERDQQLLDEGIISERRLQETMTRARIAATRLSEHRQLLQIAGLNETEIRSLETQQKLLQVLEIRAPFDGAILERMASTGERLDMMSPIYLVGDLSDLWLEINVPQESLSAIQPGMKVAVPGSPLRLPAEVASIGRSVDPATQSTVVRAILSDAGHGLKPGQFVSVQVVARRSASDSVWKVPAAAVARSGEGHFLFVRTRDGFDVRPVQYVSADADNLYVRGRLDAGDRIAISGVATLKALWIAESATDS